VQSPETFKFEYTPEAMDPPEHVPSVAAKALALTPMTKAARAIAAKPNNRLFVIIFFSPCILCFPQKTEFILGTTTSRECSFAASMSQRKNWPQVG
jgi:hypothetical protein